MENIIDNIFEDNVYYENFEKDLIVRINKYDAIDLLSKVSCSSFFLKTTIFQFDDETENYLMYEKSLKYLCSLFITKGMNLNGIKINAVELSALVKDISSFLMFNHYHQDEEVEDISYSQNTISEVLPNYMAYNLDTFFPFQTNIMNELGIDISKFKEDIFSFIRKMFGIKLQDGLTFEKYINSFDEFNEANFEYSGEYFEFFEKLSSSCGEYPELYSNKNVVNAFDRSRTCFIKANNKIYCFMPELITSKMIKYFPRLLTNEQKINWYDNRKNWSESSVKAVFEKYFPDAKIYSNNYYGASKNRFENDLLIDYKGYLFIVEVKASNVSPDSIYDNLQKVKHSFTEQVDKGIEQCNNFEKYLNDNGSVNLSFEDNSMKNVCILKSDCIDIFKITITFEEMGCFLPGYLVRHENINHNIVLNFYDLYTVLDYLFYPALIVKYFKERRIQLPNMCSINDELLYLGLFTQSSLNYPSLINEVANSQENELNFGMIEFENLDFTHKIEMYYSNPINTKPSFNINPLIKKVLDTNYKKMTNLEFDTICALLDLPNDCHEKLESSFKNNCSYLVANFTQAISNNKYTICIKPNRKICLKVCSNYFSTHLDVTKIVIIYFESNKAKVTTIKRTNPELKRYLENTRISDWNRTQY